MSFTLQTGPKIVRREVTVKEPMNGTGFKAHKLLIDFEVIPKSEAVDLSKDGDSPLLMTVIKGWGDPKRDGRGGVENADGTPVPFSEEALAQLVDIPWVSTGLARAYMDTAYGGKLGN